MELATDIMAIIGLAWVGGNIPMLCEIVSGNKSATDGLCFEVSISFGLIAASFVLG